MNTPALYSNSKIAKALRISVKWSWFKTCTWRTLWIKWPPVMCPVEPFWLFTEIYAFINEIWVMQFYWLSKSLYDLFCDLHGKDTKTLIWQKQEKNLTQHTPLYLYRTRSETRCTIGGKHILHPIRHMFVHFEFVV